MNAGISMGGGSCESIVRVENYDEIPLIIKNDSKIKSIVSAHGYEALSVFVADAPASKMVSLRLKNLRTMNSSMSMFRSKSPSSLTFALQELLVKSEDEAFQLFQILGRHRDEALKMFKTGAPALRMVSMRSENLSDMKSLMSFSPALPDVLKELLVKSEEEAMTEFQNECLDSSNSRKIEFGNDCDVDATFKDEDVKGIQACTATAAESKNDEPLPHSSEYSIDDHNHNDDGSSKDEPLSVSFKNSDSASPTECSSEDDITSLDLPKQMSNMKEPIQETGNCNLASSSNSDDDASNEKSSGDRDGCDEDGGGPSDYERLRLRNIKRNNARLAQLGPLSNSNTTVDCDVSGCASNSTPNNMLAPNNIAPNGTRKQRKKKEIVPIFRRNLPRRRCDIKRRQDITYSCTSTGQLLSATQTDSEKRVTLALGRENSSSDSSVDDAQGTKPPLKSRVEDLLNTTCGFQHALLQTLTGITLGHTVKRGTTYRGRIVYEGTRHCLGFYELATDAALAWDQAVRLLKRHNGLINFATGEEYKKLRAKELIENGLDVDLEITLAKIESSVTAIASKQNISIDKTVEYTAYSKGIRSKRQKKRYQDSLVGTRKRGTKYQSEIGHRSKSYFLGTYKLQSDAALAHDVAARAMKGPQWGGKFNFATAQAHRTSRATELKMTGLNVNLKETLTAISAKVKEIASSIEAPVANCFDNSYSTNDRLGYVITKNALATMEFNINDIVSKICYPVVGGVGLRDLKL